MKATDVRVWRRNMADIGVSLNARFAPEAVGDWLVCGKIRQIQWTERPKLACLGRAPLQKAIRRIRIRMMFKYAFNVSSNHNFLHRIAQQVA
jgi:hypothetical protein